MTWLPVVGFLAALAITTIWFDRLQGDREDHRQSISLMLQFVYAVTWGLLGAALLLMCAMSTPDMVTKELVVIGCGMALAAGLDIFFALTRRGQIGVRDFRWLVSGIVVLSSTWFVMQDIDTAKQADAHANLIHLRFAKHYTVDTQ